jgi:hypothetical protein
VVVRAVGGLVVGAQRRKLEHRPEALDQIVAKLVLRTWRSDAIRLEALVLGLSAEIVVRKARI